MRSPLLAAVLCLLVVVPAAPAHAEPTVVVDRDDAVGDVQVLQVRTSTRQQRRSIDLERAWVTALDDGSARIAVRLRDLADRGTRWEQVVTFAAEHPDVEPFMTLAFSHKPGQGGTAYSEATGEWCELEVLRRPARDVLTATVPEACLPEDGWRLRVGTASGRYEPGSLDASREWSRDGRRLGRWPAVG